MHAIRDHKRQYSILMVAALSGIVCILDLAVPLGVAAGVPYVAVVLAALVLLSRREVLIVALFCSGLTFWGFFHSPVAGGTEVWKVLVNRLLALFAIWVTAGIGLQREKFAEALQAAKEALTRSVDERTYQLSQAVDLLSAEIARREQSEEALRDSELRLTLLIEGVRDYAIFMLDPEGRVVSWNSGAERIYGYAADEIIGQHFSRFSIPQDVQTGKCEKELADAAAAGSLQHEATRIRRDNSQFLAHLLTTALFDESGALRGFAKVTRDITEERRLQDRLVQAERLAAMADAMAGLAHESRNALQRSQASLERLARRLKADPQALELIGNIQQAQDDLHRLYEEVREFAKPIHIRPQRHDVHEVLREAWRQLARARKGRRARMRDELTQVERLCEIDAFAFRQVFRNILENSLAVCEDPVAIEVEYSEVRWRDRPALRIALRDNGPGLDAQQRLRIFDAFYTTKVHGTGLGMAIAQRIVEAHGGRIVASNGTQQGAELVITLPRSQG